MAQNFGSGGGIQLSAGVNTSEININTTTPAVSTTVGAIAGAFRWGPVGVRTLVSSLDDLALKFGKPTNLNPETFWTAGSFLAYSNALYVVRGANTNTVFSAISNTAAFSANASHTVANADDYDSKVASFDASVPYIAKWPGALGNSLKVSVCETAAQFNTTIDLRQPASNTLFNDANTKLTLAVGSNVATITLANTGSLANDTPLPLANTVATSFNVGDYIEVGNSSIGKQTLKITAIGAVNVVNTAGTNTGKATFTLSLNQPLKLSTDIDSNSASRYWEYYNQVDRAPGQSAYVTGVGRANNIIDEVHVVVVDEDGEFTGTPGSVVEVFQGLSRATDAKLSDGTNNYYKNVINDQSQYIWWAHDRANASSANAATVASSTNQTPLTLSFQGGVDVSESALAFGDLARAYDLYKSPEDVDISLILTGSSRGGTVGEQLANYIIDNIAEVRKDVVVFVSPQQADVVNQNLNAAQNVVDFRNAVRGSSYAVMDSGYKYMYDQYNDVNRWIPLNGDIAGACVVTDNTRDPWYSPGGTSRGAIRNAIKLAFNPSRPERDLLYKNGVNPVISIPGEGIVLYGDKTLLTKPSAFDRINVRRLFITLEKTISAASKSFLFEFNDEFTRTQFVNTIEPFLRDVMGRRGIYDYRIVCDSSNNTDAVIEGNRFVGDIYVKPAKSINFIQLNFVAVANGIEFNEIIG